MGKIRSQAYKSRRSKGRSIESVRRKRDRIKLIKEFIRFIKENEPCRDCGNKYPYYIMEFDHIRGTKRGNISTIAENSWTQILDEMNKCDVVCANCHRIRGNNRGWK